VVKAGCGTQTALANVDAANVIIETVKPCEDAQNAYILRMYEATGDWTSAKLSFGHGVKSVKECNMLEEELSDADCGAIVFRPFEIKTIKVAY
jgi:alpha-mannosidase